jgi:hypothetical protein
MLENIFVDAESAVASYWFTQVLALFKGKIQGNTMGTRKQW